MSADSNKAGASDPAPTAGLLPPSEALDLYRRELATYRRELPRLLAEGKAGHFALIRGDQIVGVWDTQSPAIQAGRERFGLQPMFVKKIDPRDGERFAVLDKQGEGSCPP
jgi:hypothetical protein